MRNTRSFVVATIAAALVGVGLVAGAAPPSPLAAYPGFGHDPEADETRFSREEAQREDLVASCMRALGFAYTPAPSVLVGADQDGAPDITDPNAAYVAGLTEPRRIAYHLALFAVADPYAEEQPVAADGGCAERAFEAVPGVYAARNALAEPLERMEQAIAADPGVARATAGWSRCMREAGFELSSVAEMHAAADEAMAALLEADEVSPERLAELTARHEAIREADDGCDDELAAAMRAARIAHERAFVAAHRDTLEDHR